MAERRKSPELQLNRWVSQKLWLRAAALSSTMEVICLVSRCFSHFICHVFVRAEICWRLSCSDAPRQRENGKESEKGKGPSSEVDDVLSSPVWESGSCRFKAVRLFHWQRVKPLAEALVWSCHLTTYRCHPLFVCSQMKKKNKDVMKSQKQQLGMEATPWKLGAPLERSFDFHTSAGLASDSPVCILHLFFLLSPILLHLCCDIKLLFIIPTV